MREVFRIEQLLRAVVQGACVFALCLTATLSAAGLDQADLQTALDAVLDHDPTARRTTIALKVVDLETGKVLYDRFGDRLFTPASNLKIYTSACALDRFGPEHVFPTQITASVDQAKGVIRGNLTLIGGGDAMFSSGELAKLADRLVDQWKVRELHGQIVVDNSRYSEPRLGPGWMWDDQQHYYNMRVTPLMVDFNAVADPERIDEEGDPVRVAMKDPQSWVVNQFSAMLRSRGVKISASDKTAVAGETRTLAFAGTNLAETLKHFNHQSENAVGEVLLHEIAIAAGKTHPTWADGANEITHWLHDTVGLEKGSFKLVDGSGLSRYNLISADSSVKLLAFMRKHKHAATFFASLPPYEVETSSGVKQKLVRAKPGGMRSVSTISGYLETLTGRRLAFSMLANGFIGKSKPVQKLRGKVWSVLARYEREVE